MDKKILMFGNVEIKKKHMLLAKDSFWEVQILKKD